MQFFTTILAGHHKATLFVEAGSKARLLITFHPTLSGKVAIVPVQHNNAHKLKDVQTHVLTVHSILS